MYELAGNLRCSMKQRIALIGFAILFSLLPNRLFAENYTLAVAVNTIDTVVSEVIVKKAYEMLGHNIQIIRLPPKRALEDANSGIYDGDVQRIFSVEEHYPNLIRIEPAINYINGTGFVLKGRSVKAATWQDLKKYKVGIILGIRFAETNVPKENSFVYYSYTKLTEALKSGKIDIGIYPESNGIFQTLLAGDESIVPLEAPLARFELFHYIHNKNKALKSGLQQLFEDFKKEGRLVKVRKQVLEISFARARKQRDPCFEDYKCYQSVWDN